MGKREIVAVEGGFGDGGHGYFWIKGLPVAWSPSNFASQASKKDLESQDFREIGKESSCLVV